MSDGILHAFLLVVNIILFSFFCAHLNISLSVINVEKFENVMNLIGSKF